MKKKTLLFILPALFATVSCNAGSKFYSKDIPEYGHFFDVEPYEVKDTKNIGESSYFKFHGRHYFDNSLQAEFLSFSNSGFEVTFVGTTLEGYFFTTKADDIEKRPYLSVTIDNDYNPDHSFPISLTADKYSNSQRREGAYFVHEHVVLAHGLEYGKHTIRVYKKSECLMSKVAIKSLSCDGEFVTVEPKEMKMKMEFYGDSVTCGYAVESPDFYENFSTRTENSLMSYANYAANELSADVSLISCGGYPMYKSRYSEGCNPSTIPEMVSLADVEYNTTNRHIWDNASYVPDVVVIALGANDGSVLSGLNNESSQKQFLKNYKSTYISFIEKLFTLYPKTLIVISDEILWIDPRFVSAMDEIASSLSNEGKNVIRAKYEAYDLAKDKNLPGNGHPNKEMQKTAGHELSETIRAKIGE